MASGTASIDIARAANARGRDFVDALAYGAGCPLVIAVFPQMKYCSLRQMRLGSYVGAVYAVMSASVMHHPSAQELLCGSVDTKVCLWSVRSTASASIF